MTPRPVVLPVAEPDVALAEARGGSAAAFETLVRQHQAMVFSLACHFLGDRCAAEDLAQDVFLELFRNLERITSPSHLRFWLRKVATNRCIDRIRSRRSSELSLEVLPDRAAPCEERDVLLGEHVRRVLGELPTHARAVMILRYQEDMDPSEIAQVLEMPVNTVKSHLRRSVDMMRTRLGGKVPA